MKVGIVLPQTGRQATKDNVMELAQKSEKEGFDSLWVFDRLLWPLEPQTPYRGTADGCLPDDMQNVFDPLATLTFAAAKTEKIALGTCVVDMLFHNPVILARRFATLDVLSGGRVICGLALVGQKMSTRLPISHLNIGVKGQMNLSRHLKRYGQMISLNSKENFIIFHLLK
jgi:alkanesulfonate monooxygenase SsuD/methylene tetrahydromethanopterin reductase-like flavin-dependent oxidoreductase (luciferase family)